MIANLMSKIRPAPTVEQASERLSTLRAEHASAAASANAARAAIGGAIVDGDGKRVAALRGEITLAESLAVELASAIPIAEARLRDAQQRAADRAQAAEQRRQNELRERRLRAAAEVDTALRALEVAYAGYERADAGMTGIVRERLGRRASFALSAAFYSKAPNVAGALGVKRAALHHMRPLAASEAAMIPVHQVTAEEAAQ